MSNAEFKRAFSALLARVGNKADLVVRKTALDLYKHMVFMSPVDTGRFRANWQCGIGAADIKTDSEFDMGRATMTLQGWDRGHTIFLTNSLPYSRALENGHSTQAPAGMVKLTIQNYTIFLRDAVKGIK